MEDKPKNIISEEQQLAADRYRFGCFKFSLRAPADRAPSD
jgi:hypothetical protein